MSKKKEIEKKEDSMHESDEFEDLEDEVEEEEKRIDLEKLRKFFGEGGEVSEFQMASNIEEIGVLKEVKVGEQSLESQVSGVKRLESGEGDEIGYRVSQEEERVYETGVDKTPKRQELIVGNERKNYVPSAKGTEVNPNPLKRGDVNLNNSEGDFSTASYETGADVEKMTRQDVEKRKYEIKK